MLSMAGPCGPESAITPEFDTQHDAELVDETHELMRVVIEAQAANSEPWLEPGALGLCADARRPERDDDDSDFDDFDDDADDEDEDDDLQDDLDEDDFAHGGLEEDFDEFDDAEEP